MAVINRMDKMVLTKFSKKIVGIASYHGAFHPVTGKKPPTLEEFDPLNPGEWQLGVSAC
jgi:hypothetical protein